MTPDVELGVLLRIKWLTRRIEEMETELAEARGELEEERGEVEWLKDCLLDVAEAER